MGLGISQELSIVVTKGQHRGAEVRIVNPSVESEGVPSVVGILTDLINHPDNVGKVDPQPRAVVLQRLVNGRQTVALRNSKDLLFSGLEERVVGTGSVVSHNLDWGIARTIFSEIGIEQDRLVELEQFFGAGKGVYEAASVVVKEGFRSNGIGSGMLFNLQESIPAGSLMFMKFYEDNVHAKRMALRANMEAIPVDADPNINAISQKDLSFFILMSDLIPTEPGEGVTNGAGRVQEFMNTVYGYDFVDTKRTTFAVADMAAAREFDEMFRKVFDDNLDLALVFLQRYREFYKRAYKHKNTGIENMNSLSSRKSGSIG